MLIEKKNYDTCVQDSMIACLELFMAFKLCIEFNLTFKNS